MIASSISISTTSPSVIQPDLDEHHGGDRVSAREFWSNLGWELLCFPERYNLVQQHRDAGLDPRDEQNLNAAPLGTYSRPSTFTSRTGRTVSID